jgi:hypothetical protein
MGMLTPDFWIEERLTKFPESSGETIRLISNRPLAEGSQGFVQGRVKSISTISRSLSDAQGNWVRGRFSWEETDADRALRILFESDDTNALVNREATVFLQSEESRVAGGGTPYTAFRGLIQDATPTTGMGNSRVCQDWLGSKLSPFSVDKKIGANRRLTRDLFDFLERDLINHPAHWVLGEVSDAGRKDTKTGLSIAKGKVPCIRVGTAAIDLDGTVTPITNHVGDSVTIEHVQPPTLVSAVVVGTPGTRSVAFAVTAVTDAGQTTLSNIIVVTNVPNVLTPTNYVQLTWAAPAAHADLIKAYIPYVNDAGGTPNNRLDTMNNGGTWVSPELTYQDNGDDSHFKGDPPPDQNTAVVVVTAPGGGSPMLWGVYYICAHAVNPAEMHELFGPTWETGGEPFRGAMPEGVFGVDVLAPGRTGWPHATPYVDVTDRKTGKVHRMTIMYARGPRDFYAQQGKAGWAWNMCGIEDVGDGTGEPIRKAAYLYQHVLSELIAANNGEGYYSGVWAGLPYFRDGITAMIDSQSMEDFQAYTIAQIGGIGVKLDTLINDEPTTGAFISAFDVQFEVFSGTNTYGQLCVKFLNLSLPAPTANLYRVGIEVERIDGPVVDYTALVNRVNYQWAYDWELNKYIADAEKIENETSQQKYLGGVADSEVYGLKLIADRTTAQYCMGLKLFRLSTHAVYQTYYTRLIHLRNDIGDQVLLTADQGLGPNGYQAARFFITRMELNVRTGLFAVTGLRLDQMTAALAPVLIDTLDTVGTAGFVLGDSTSTAAPPAGAYRLR